VQTTTTTTLLEHVVCFGTLSPNSNNLQPQPGERLEQNVKFESDEYRNNAVVGGGGGGGNMKEQEFFPAVDREKLLEGELGDGVENLVKLSDVIFESAIVPVIP
jgi:hypothetical protein